MQSGRIAQRGLKKMKLLPGWPGGLRFESYCHDRMFRPERFQVRLKQAEQNVHRTGRIGNVKAMLVARLVRPGESVSPVGRIRPMADLWRIGESQPQPDLPRDEIARAEAEGELLEKTSEDKKERFDRLDLVLELHFLREDLRWPNESQEPRCPPVRLLPKLNRDRTEPRPKLIWLERGELAQGVHAPFVEDGDAVGNFRGARGGG